MKKLLIIELNLDEKTQKLLLNSEAISVKLII